MRRSSPISARPAALAQRMLGGVDASRIVRRLWMGAFPPTGSTLSDLGFKVLVLCAHERQLPSERWPGLTVIHAPLDDGPLDPEARATAAEAAELVVRAVRRGLPVLVTCAAGRNRSGLVTALALCGLYGCSGRASAMHIRARRRHALTNPWFARWLGSLAKPSRAGQDPVTEAR